MRASDAKARGAPSSLCLWRWLLAISACAFGLVMACLAWVERVDRGAAERYAMRLENLASLGSTLTAEVLKTRTGLVPHYDGLVRTERTLAALYTTLRRSPGFLDAQQTAQLLAELGAAERASQATFQLVERFKSENAVLRNSLLFLRTAAAAIDAYPGTTSADRAFREDASALVRDVLLLRLFPDATLLERVRRNLPGLERYVQGLPAERSADLRLVLAHAAAVYDHAPVMDRLVRAIVEQPSAGPTQRLIMLYGRYHRAALASENQRTAGLLSLLLAFGLCVAAAIIARMRRSTAELRHTGEQLRQALDALRVEQAKQRELSELKTRFVSMTSHEFRTPLSTIMSSSEMLCAYDDRWSPEKKATHFGRIRLAVLNMTRMLDAILLIGKSEAGRLEFKPGPVHLARLCADAAEIATKSLGQRHQFSVRAPLEDDLVVLADEALLRQVVDNLLNNAIKYSPQGGSIEFVVRREGDSVVFDVKDQGIGIPARDRERLFEVFHRGANVGSVAGSGLGLSIVKRAVDLHGGSVEVESEVGVGSRFVVRMPCPRSAA